MDLFEKVKELIGCENISDMKVQPYIDKAKLAMCEIKSNDYSVKDFEDMAEYLYGEKKSFDCQYDAECYFKEKVLNNLHNSR